MGSLHGAPAGRDARPPARPRGHKVRARPEVRLCANPATNYPRITPEILTGAGPHLWLLLVGSALGRRLAELLQPREPTPKQKAPAMDTILDGFCPVLKFPCTTAPGEDADRGTGTRAVLDPSGSDAPAGAPRWLPVPPVPPVPASSTTQDRCWVRGHRHRDEQGWGGSGSRKHP